MKTDLLLALVAVLCSPGTCASAQTAAAASKPANSELATAIQTVLEETHTPGAAVALVGRDGITWVRGFGKADLANSKDVTADTVFRVGSISKSFVSMAVLKLCEEGKLSLEARLRDLAPEIAFSNPWEDSDPVKIVHLLEHTSGFDDIHLREYAHNDPSPVSLLEGLKFNPNSRTSRWKPGVYFSYCNSGPAVAAYVVQKITGRKFEDYVWENLFHPLGMSTASYLLEPRIQQNLAKSYVGEDLREVPYEHILMRPAGSLNCSARELANLVQMLIRRGSFGGRNLLGADSIARMETPTSTMAAREGIQAGYGLGNYTTAHRGFLLHGHEGGIDAFLAAYAYHPRAGVGYVYMINAANSKAFGDIGKLLRDYVVRDLTRLSSPLVELPGHRLQALARYYEPIAPRQELARFLDRILGVILVKVEGGKLTVSPLFGDSRDLIPVTDRRFRGEDDPLASVVFLPDEEGELMVQGYSRALTGTFRSRPAVLVSLERVLWILVGLFMVSSPAFSVAWIPRWLLGRTEASLLSLRVLPLLAVLTLVLAGILLYACASPPEVFHRLGKRTAWSVSFFLLTWLFAGFSLSGLARVLHVAGRPMNRNVWVHSLVVSVSNCVLAAYLYYWGIIGIRTWAI